VFWCVAKAQLFILLTFFEEDNYEDYENIDFYDCYDVYARH